MFRIITPTAFYENICQIDIQALADTGIRGLLFDLDNTITTWNNPDLNEKTLEWFNQLAKSKIRGCIVSNNSPERISPIAISLKLQFVARAKKPLPKGYKRAMILLSTDVDNTIMVGDQLYTDILGANLAGIQSFLVKPISLDNEFLGTRINRKLETVVMKKVMKNINQH